MSTFIIFGLLAALGLPRGLEITSGPEVRLVETVAGGRGVSCLAVAGETLYVGLEGGGVRVLGPGPATILDSARGLPGNRVTGCEVLAGELWVTTEAGVARLDSASGRFSPVISGNFVGLTLLGAGLAAARPDGSVVNPLEPGRNLWEPRREFHPLSLAGSPEGHLAMGSSRGGIRLDGRSFRVPAPVIGLAFDRGELLVLTPGQGYRIREDRIMPEPGLEPLDFISPRGLRVQAAPGLVRAAATWRGGVVVGTDEGLFLQEPSSAGSARWSEMDLGTCPCGPRLSSLVVHRGALWVGGFDSGLCRLDSRGWTRFAGPEHLASDMVNKLASDGRNLYVATLGGMTIVDRKGTFTVRTHGDCVPGKDMACPWHPNVTGFAPESGSSRVWMADNGAVHRLSRNRWKHFYRESGLTSGELTRIAVQGCRVAVGSVDQGVFLRDCERGFQRMDFNLGPTGGWIMDLSFDSGGRLWAGTCTSGVSVLSGRTWTTLGTNSGLIDDYTLTVKEVDSRLWVGTLSGLSLLTPFGFRSFTPGQGLGGREVHDLVEWKGRLYLATDAGLSVLELGPDVTGG